MPCGWGCGAELTAREMRKHFTECPLKPGPGQKVAAVRPTREGGPVKKARSGETTYERVDNWDV